MPRNGSLNSFHPNTRLEWREWLAENHTRTEGSLYYMAGLPHVLGQPCRYFLPVVLRQTIQVIFLMIKSAFLPGFSVSGRPVYPAPSLHPKLPGVAR